MGKVQGESLRGGNLRGVVRSFYCEARINCEELNCEVLYRATGNMTHRWQKLCLPSSDCVMKLARLMLFWKRYGLARMQTCQADHVRPLSVTVNNDNIIHFSCWYSPQPRRYTRRRTEHEAACQQRSKNLFLSSSPYTPGSPSCWIWCYSATCACSSHVAYWLL